MLECLILGDSLAVGIASYRHECEVHAKVGINSTDFNRRYCKNYSAGITVISLGSNDVSNLKPTKANLMRLRDNIASRHVFWVLPRNSDAVRAVVKEIANQHGDTTIDARQVKGDTLHPTMQGYKILASETKPTSP